MKNLSSPFGRPQLLGNISRQFGLAVQTGDTGRVKRPVQAAFRPAYRREVENWLLAPGESVKTDKELVLHYLVELRDLSYDDQPQMCVADVLKDRRAAAMIAAVFLQNLVE